MCIFVATRQLYKDACLSPQDQDAPIQPASLKSFECKTMHLFHHNAHILQFGDQLMERLLGAITRSGYVVAGAYIWIQSVRLFSCEDRLIWNY